jgi:microcin C transport system substrate-binding protein
MMRFVALLAAAALIATPAIAEPTYGLSLLGELKLPADFTHFTDANPDAPKGGSVALAAVGSFDSLNPFIIRGSPASSVARVWDMLMTDNVDEAASSYAHLAQSVDVAADHKSVTFVLRPEAHFNDGTPVREHGRPSYRTYWGDVADAQATGDRTVVFHFKSDENHELPYILGELPVLPEHWWKGRDFEAPLTDPPLGSGPYRVDRVELGRTIVLKRVPDWWAVNQPTGRGLSNFDTIRYDYYRDPDVAFEAFKAGQADFRQENSAKNWATRYDFPAVASGLVKRESLPHRLPTGMQAFAMNTRRTVFADRRVRQAMDEVFDFQWMNKNLFYGRYTRTDSYFSNSEYASSGIPQGAELALLEPFRAKLPPELFTSVFTLPVTDGSGNNRDGLRNAIDLLKQAGWTVKDRKMVNAAGEQMSFEILLNEPAFERIGLPYAQWLGRLGIDAHIRTVDVAQYQKRMDDLDYDMAVVTVGESASLGNEQVDYWSCASAKQPGTENYAGVCDPAVDALVADIVSAKDHAALLTAAHALDRVLLWNWYMVPQWHLRQIDVAYWNRFGHTTAPVRTGLDFNAWWVDPALAAATDAARGH